MQDSVHASTNILNNHRTGSWPQRSVQWSPVRQRFFNRKYALERYVGSMMLVGFAPAIGALWLLVRVTSRGPGFYRQERVGLHGKCFDVIKLRSMQLDAEQDGEAIWCLQDDRRVTLLGKVMRKLHLDELPQLWNVARGEMAIVGPRPERPSICDALAQKIEGYYDRTIVKPGISGLAQINLPADQCLEDVQRKQILDLHYINETSHWFEFRILVATALRLVGVKGETIIKLMRLCRRSLVEPDAVMERSSTQMERRDPKAITIASPKFQPDSLETSLDGRGVSSKLPARTRPLVAAACGDGFKLGACHDPAKTSSRSNGVSSASETGTKVPNCMTIDVEDYFQVSAFADRVTRSDWSRYECRVESNTDRVLRVLDDASVRGTFFVLGWVAERYPALVRRIAAGGHELASHGYWHQLVYDLTPEQFKNDVIASQEAIYNACGVEVTAYRAPSFSIVPRSRWALDVLAELGFQTDSSVFPMSGHDRYGDPDAPTHIHRVSTAHGDLIEVPPTVGRVGRMPVPIGGGYFRLFPLRMTQRSIGDVRNRIGPAMFYLHPWELDPDQPRVFADAAAKQKFRHYVGLRNTEAKLKSLLRTHAFDTMKNVVQATMPSPPTANKRPLSLIRRRESVPVPASVLQTLSSVGTTVQG